MKVRLIIVCAIAALAFPAVVLADNPKTGPITNDVLTCSGLSFDYHDLPANTRVRISWTLGSDYVRWLEQLFLLSGSGTFSMPVPVALEQPTTLMDARVRVPSQGPTLDRGLDRGVPSGCTPAPPSPPQVVVPPPPAPPTTVVTPPPTAHHKMCHHRRRCHCGHKHRGHREHRHRFHKRHRHKLRICKLPGGGGHICGTPVRKSGNG